MKLGSTNAALVFNSNGLVPTNAASSVKPNADYIIPGCPAEGWMLGLDNNKALNLNNNNAGRLRGRSCWMGGARLQPPGGLFRLFLARSPPTTSACLMPATAAPGHSFVGCLQPPPPRPSTASCPLGLQTTGPWSSTGQV